MERILEPELMEEHDQALAYANANFEDAHGRFVPLWRESFPGLAPEGHALDVGCGPGDITFRFARAFPLCAVDGVDGSTAMLELAMAALRNAPDLSARVRFIQARLPDDALPRAQYDAIISNSLLHHLRDPQALWRSVRAAAKPGAPVFVMDLRRAENVSAAQDMVTRYASGEPEILRRDLCNSLLAAFEPSEVEAQLRAAQLDHLTVRPIGDRHLLVAGRF